MSEVQKFRKKPVVVEAWQFWSGTGVGDGNGPEVCAWVGNSARLNGTHNGGSPALWLEITTLEGVMEARNGDWIIKGVQGEFYLCKPDIFAATYEPVEAGENE